MKNPPINNISKNEIHIFIIWEKARYKEDEIFNNLKKDFLIIDVIDIEWSKSLFSNNLTRFYGQNLPIGSHKEEHVGNGEFRLIIIQDKKPLYQARQTSKGISFVNINTFDRKSFFRELTGGGHKIHSSNTETESRHDLFLILGIDAKKYFNKTSNEWDNKIKSHRGDLVGANSWSNLDELFVIMDNTIDEYVVLKKKKKLPHHYDSKIHGDIDLLLKNSQNANYVINGKKVYVDEFRVLNNVKFKNGNILFDFRYLGDNYIDINWGRDILKNFEYYHSLRVPNKEDHFYSLLYHAYIHKEELPNKYQNLFHKILPESLKDIDANFFNSMDNITKLLNEFLIQKNYNFTMPDDITVMFNLDGIIDSKIKVDKKHTVVNRYIDKNKYGLVRSRVDVVSKNDVPMIRKLASGALSSREFHFLKSLEAYKYFPKVNNLFVGKNFSLFFQEFIQGKKN